MLFYRCDIYYACVCLCSNKEYLSIYLSTMVLIFEEPRAMVVSFEDDLLFGGVWRMRRLIHRIDGARVSVVSSSFDTTYEERRECGEN